VLAGTNKRFFKNPEAQRLSLVANSHSSASRPPLLFLAVYWNFCQLHGSIYPSGIEDSGEYLRSPVFFGLDEIFANNRMESPEAGVSPVLQILVDCPGEFSP
jgi:hypothetical protein